MPFNINDSVLSYGGVEIPFVKTEVFRQDAWFSPEGLDMLGIHFTIGVSGILNKCFLNGVDPAVWIEENRPLLLQRGKQLYFYIGGTQTIPPATLGGGSMPTTGNELVSSPEYDSPAASEPLNPVSAPLDARLGPRPLRLDIRAIRGGTYAIYFEIETWVPYCTSATPIAAILSNRWESAVDIDKDYYYTRTTSGTLILNGQYLEETPAAELLAEDAAVLIFPPLFNSWKREIVRFTLSADQLTLNYVIQDRQQYVSIPRPAVQIDASYAEVCPGPQVSSSLAPAMMNLMGVNMDVTVYGDPNVQIDNSYPTGSVNPDRLKYTLMQIMFQLIFSRIPFPFTTTSVAGQTFENSTMITHFELREDVMRPIVGCRIVGYKTRALTANPLGSQATWQSNIFALTEVGAPLMLADMLAQISTQPVSVGNWATFLLLASVAPRDPCAGGCVPAVMGQYAPFSTTVYSTQIGSSQTSIGTGYAQTVNLSYSQANYQYPFTEFTATVEFPTDNHYIQTPIMYDVEQDTTTGTTEASSDFWQTASPTSRKIIHWKASRVGSWPKIPTPNSVDSYGGSLPSDRVLHYNFQFGEIELANDGITRHYSAAGVYEIGMARRVQWDAPTSILSTICGQVIGSATYGDTDSSFPTPNFVTGMLNAGPSPGNS